MQQRQPRLGDVVDDYCPRERRVTNHAVVAMVGDEIKQTRCTTCDAEHEYKQARVPPQRKKKEVPGALYQQVLDGIPRVVPPTDSPSTNSQKAVDEPPGARASPNRRPRRWGPPTPRPRPTGTSSRRPVHRRLIRATLPRLGDEMPVRREPEFTMRAPAHGRPGKPKNGFRGGSGGQHAGGGHPGQADGNRAGKRHGRPGGGGVQGPGVDRPGPRQSRYRQPRQVRGKKRSRYACASRPPMTHSKRASAAHGFRAACSHSLRRRTPTAAGRDGALRADGRCADLCRSPARAANQAGRHRGIADVLEAGRLLRRRKAAPWPGEVGPFYIEGATPGDTLVVQDPPGAPEPRHGRLDVIRQAISAVAGDNRTRMLNDPLPVGASSGGSIASAMVGMLDIPNSASKRDRAAARADAGPRRRGARRRGSLRRPVARQLRRQHGRVGRPRGHHRLSARLPRRRVLLLRRRPRAAGRRRDLRLRPRDDDGRDAAVRSRSRAGRSTGRGSRTRRTSWSPAAAGRWSTRSASPTSS